LGRGGRAVAGGVALTRTALQRATLALLLALAGAAPAAPDAPATPDTGARHELWELHGKHNTVYLLGSVHVLRAADYPLAKPLLDAYAAARALVMEVDLDTVDIAALQAEMLRGALLGDGKTLPEVLGPQRYARARALSQELHIDLSEYDRYAPWFVAEMISQRQLAAQGFAAESGVEMYFLGKARHDGKTISGLETVHDQLVLFENMPLAMQSAYLLESLEDAHALPTQLDAMVHAWKTGDDAWFAAEIQHEFAQEPALYASLVTNRNRQWLPKIENLLKADENYLVIVGTGHLVGRGNVLELLAHDGITAIQR
jgi:uncharacterized protein YbaP (TraB family)